MLHCVIINDASNVVVFGKNNHGQLGLGDFEDRCLHTEIKGLPPIVAVSTAYEYTLFLDENGRVLLCEDLLYQNRIYTPISIGLPNIKKMASGFGHSLLLDSNGGVFSFGSNRFGQLGIGHGEFHSALTRLSGIPYIVDISCGMFHSMLLDKEGNCWAFGNNYTGSAGLGDIEIQNKPMKIENLPPIQKIVSGYYHNILIDVDDKIYICGNLGLGDGAKRTPEVVIGLPRIKYAACGEYYTMLIDEDGDVWGFGFNKSGQLGLGHNNGVYFPKKLSLDYKVSLILIFKTSTFLINESGKCFACGSNKKGRLGLDYLPVENTNVPLKINNLKVNLSVYGKKFHTKSARN